MVVEGDLVDGVNVLAKVFFGFFLDGCFLGFLDFILLFGYIFVFMVGECFVGFWG